MPRAWSGVCRSVVPSRAAENAAKGETLSVEARREALGEGAAATAGEKRVAAEVGRHAAAQACTKVVWGSIEEAGRVVREKAAASAVAQTGAERAGERRVAAQKAS